MASERFQRQIDRLLDEAEAALGQFDWEAVNNGAEAVLALDPGNADGLALLAAVERARGGAKPTAPSLTEHPGTQSAAVDAQPTSFANGRYKVKRFLGEGGKKKV